MFQPVVPPKQFAAFGCEAWSAEDAARCRLICVPPELGLDFSGLRLCKSLNFMSPRSRKRRCERRSVGNVSPLCEFQTIVR